MSYINTSMTMKYLAIIWFFVSKLWEVCAPALHAPIAFLCRWRCHSSSGSFTVFIHCSCLYILTGNQHLSTNDSQVEVIKQPSSVVLTEGLATPYSNKTARQNSAVEVCWLIKLAALWPCLQEWHCRFYSWWSTGTCGWPWSQFNHCKKQITDLPTRIQAFSSKPGHNKLNHKGASHGSHGPHVFNGSAVKRSGRQPLAPIW